MTNHSRLKRSELAVTLSLAALLSTACGAGDDSAAGFGAATGGGGGAGEASGAGGATAAVGGGAGEAGALPSGPLVCDGPGARFVTDVLSVDYGPGQTFGRVRMPAVVHGPPRGGGCCSGSLDVVSLGNGGEIVLAFEGNGIADGPGVDFVIFENPFEPSSGGVFAELATVAVSDDGVSWHTFECSASEPPYGSCAGHHPVFLDGDDGPLDPQTSGGDPFDLADVGVAEARYVRIVDRPDLQGLTGVFDLDAVGIVNAACP